MRSICLFIVFMFAIQFADAQFNQDNFVLNGNTTKIGDSCFLLTQERNNDVGSIWFKNRIDLNFDFEVNASINLGRLDGLGADGIAFVLQPLSSTIGGFGGGLGYAGVSPSLTVEFDTWQNDDPPYDHIALVKNGDLSHYSSPAFTLQGPVEMLPNQANAEDDKYRNVRFVWDAKAKRLTAYYDNVLKINYTGDIINTVFNGNPYVYWGFTAATGGAINNQSVCLAKYNVTKEFECPTKTVSGTTQVCQGDSIKISVSNGSSYSWSGPNNFRSTQSSFTIPNASSYNSGKYVVIVSDTCKNKDTLSIDVVVNPRPVVPARAETICSGGRFTYTPVSNGNTTIIPVNTTYTWTVAPNTNVSGQSNQSSPQSSISQTLTNLTNQVQTVVYIVTPTSGAQGNCVGSTFTLTVTVNPRPVIPTQSSTICSGSTFTVNLADNASTTIIPLGTTYAWVVAANANVSGQTNQSSPQSSINQNLTNLTNQVQTVVYTVTPTSGAQGSCAGNIFIINVTVNPKPSINTQPKSICSGSGFTFTPENGNGNIVPSNSTYTWTVLDNSNVTGESGQTTPQSSIGQNLTNTSTQLQQVVYTITPSSGAQGNCQGSPFTLTVTVNPKPSITNKTTAICSGNSFAILPQNTGADVVPPGSIYSWTVAANANVTGQSNQNIAQSNVSQTLTNVTNQVQTIFYTVTPSVNGNCTGNSFIIAVTVNPKPSINTQSASSCTGIAFTFSPENSSGNIIPSNTTYTWSTPAVSTSITGGSSGNGTSISGKLTNSTNLPQTATYTITPTSGNCVGSSFTTIVTVNTKPFVFAGNDTTIFFGEQIQLNCLAGADVRTFQWTPSTYLSCTNCQRPVSFPKNRISYAVTVKNEKGCESTDSIKIDLKCTEKNYFIPNTFSPNNDGINDIFYPRGEYIQKVTFLRVFNRWGELIFEQENFSINDRSKGWDGTFKGKKLDKGVFAYSAQLICGDGQLIDLKGSIMILQ